MEIRDIVLRNPTLKYFGVSDSSKLRRLEEVLSFFQRFPPIIRIEASRMANPAYVIEYLATHRESASMKRNWLRDRFIVGFLFWTGVRVNELLSTRVDDVDLITKTYNVPTLKQRKHVYRPIPLNHVPTEELRLWDQYIRTIVLKIRKEEWLVRLSDRQVERIVKKALGPDFTPHTLRHGLGLWLYEYTKDVRIVAQVLRHTNIANTLIYTRLSLEAIREKISIE